MTTEEIAKALCEHCRNGTEAEGLDTLYSKDAVSVEPMAMEGMDPVSTGVEAIRGKHAWWNAAMEVHSLDLQGPYVHGDRFAVVFDVDCTDKASGRRWRSKEVGLYEVADGKIVRESFFMPSMS